MKKLLLALTGCALLFLLLLLPSTRAGNPARTKKESAPGVAKKRPSAASEAVAPPPSKRPNATPLAPRPPLAAESQDGARLTHTAERVEPEEFNGDVRDLPRVSLKPKVKLNLKKPADFRPIPDEGVVSELQSNVGLAAMPAPNRSFDGMSRESLVSGGFAGSGWPPDVTGDVGLNHYIQAVNSSWAIYNKTGTLLAAFTEDALWANATGGTPCTGSNRGDPVVVYDQFADRWILTNFAFGSGSGGAVPPFYQCFAVSKTGDPVGGGWWLYALRMDMGGANFPPVGTLADYPKFGNWNDGCLYMSANGFAGQNFNGVLYASFNKSDMQNGAPLTWALGFIPHSNFAPAPFTMLPSNISGARDPASLPLPGTPNYFVSQSVTLFAYEVRKFTPGARCGGGGTLSPPSNVGQSAFFNPSDGTFGPTANNIIPQPSTFTALDSLGPQLMQNAQYRKVGAAESLWVTHTVRTANGAGSTGQQWAQINVTGGAVAATPVQQQIYKPDTLTYRWAGSIAADHVGNAALGYSTSSAASFPGIAYSGRLVTDPLNNLSQTETQLVAGGGAQVSCNGSPCSRWGDYTAMSVDPSDDCTFWYTNQYYNSQANGSVGHWQTRIGSFRFPSCAGATSCAFGIAPASNSVGSGATSGSVAVTTTAGCNWTATSNAAFITIIGGASGAGAGTVTYSVAANPAASPRTGTLTIAGRTFTVTQSAAPCLYSISPTSQTFSSAAGAGSVAVTAPAGCGWAAASNSSFMTITSGGSGSGVGTVGYAVAANTTTSSRAGTLTIAGQTFTATQAAGGATCPTTAISFGQTLSGALSTSDCRFTDGSFLDLYTFNGVAGQQVSVAMSASFDTFLFLLAPDGSTLAFDNNGGGGTNSRIPAASGLLTLPVNGTYTIIANSLAPSVFGSYSLALAGVTPSSAVQFSVAAYSVNEVGGAAVITVRRTGSTAGVSTVSYATVDDPASVRCDVANGTAYARCDYATTIDTLTFAAGQSQLTFAVPIVNDAHAEGAENLTLRLMFPDGATLGAQSTATLTVVDNDAVSGPNPISTHPFFVRQQYLDFLSREPDAGGLQAWLNVLNTCPNVNNNATCDRVTVSSSFFRSREFQLKGLYTYLFYKVSFGRLPEYAEITPDMRSVTGLTDVEVHAKRAAFADAWVRRPAFRSAYDPVTNAGYVDALLGRYGLSQITTPDPANPEGATLVLLTRADLVGRLNAGTLTRARLLRAVVESREVDAREFNGAFVAMQYYGYLRRTPEQPGYTNWLNYLNANPTDFRTMVGGFVNSAEYRLRFGTP